MLEQMGILLNVYEATRAYSTASDPTSWAEQQPAAWEVYAWARELERKHVN